MTDVAGYVACILACKYAVQPYAPRIARLIYQGAAFFTNLDPSGVLRFYTGNWFVFNLVAGATVGFVVYSVWRRMITMLVWIPFALVLCQKMLVNTTSVLLDSGGSSGISYFLSRGCLEFDPRTFYASSRCWDQFNIRCLSM